MGAYEDKVKELKAIVKEIEQGDIDDIDNFVVLYRRGQQLSKELRVELEAKKEKIKQIEKGSG